MSRTTTTREQRVETANEFLRIISEHGRHFFRTFHRNHGRPYEEVDCFELDGRGRVWFRQRWDDSRIYTHYTGAWRGFMHGGTLRLLIRALCNYIMGRADLPTLGPWPEWVCGGDLWGYGSEMEKVRERINLLEEDGEDDPG